jgi:predicted nucleic acid-binding protein
MLVVDTSAFVSLSVGGILDVVLEDFTVTKTETVLLELEATAEYDDVHGDTARGVLDARDQFTILDIDGNEYETSRVDAGEASCIAAVQATDASFLLTDDFRALPELQRLVNVEVALFPIVLRALVKRGALEDAAAREAFERIAEGRDWLEAPIYRYAQQLLE